MLRTNFFAQEPKCYGNFYSNHKPYSHLFSQSFTQMHCLYSILGDGERYYIYNNKQCVCTYLIRSGRRSTSFGCVCFRDLEGDKATVQHNISSVDSSTGCEGVFSSAI